MSCFARKIFAGVLVIASHAMAKKLAETSKSSPPGRCSTNSLGIPTLELIDPAP